MVQSNGQCDKKCLRRWQCDLMCQMVCSILGHFTTMKMCPKSFQNKFKDYLNPHFLQKLKFLPKKKISTNQVTLALFIKALPKNQSKEKASQLSAFVVSYIVTRWLDYFLIFGFLQKVAQNITILPKWFKLLPNTKLSLNYFT